MYFDIMYPQKLAKTIVCILLKDSQTYIPGIMPIKSIRQNGPSRTYFQNVTFKSMPNILKFTIVKFDTFANICSR